MDTFHFPSLGWLDWVMLGVLALSIVIGLLRGLVFEVLSLIGWVVALVAAQMFFAPVAMRLPVGQPGDAANVAAAFALVFVVVLIAWSLAAKLVRMLVQATPLSGIDRVLGGAFGVLRGLVLLLVVATIAMLTPAHASRAWHESTGARWLETLLHGVRPYLPSEIDRHLPNSAAQRA